MDHCIIVVDVDVCGNLRSGFFVQVFGKCLLACGTSLCATTSSNHGLAECVGVKTVESIGYCLDNYIVIPRSLFCDTGQKITDPKTKTWQKYVKPLPKHDR